MSTRNSTILAALVAALVLPLSLLAGPSQAAESKAKPKRKNQTTAVTCTPTGASPYAEPRAEYYWSQLRAAGYSPAASAGVLGYLDYRSGLAPQAIADDKSGYGIAQWSPQQWDRFKAANEADPNGQRWSPKRQVLYLIADMATDPGNFDSASFAQATDPGEAARQFAGSYNPVDVSDEAVAAAVSGKARAWFAALSGTDPVDAPPALANGVQMPCVPEGVVVTRCPMVPLSFKRKFASFTGYSWDRLSPNAQMLSRCVYINFPYIASQGTYAGHMPNWNRALDLFVPNGCRNDGGRRYTTSSVDAVIGGRVTRYLISNARRIGIDYVIWQDHIRNPGEHSNETYWAPVSYWRQDTYNNGDCVNTHYDHVHASVYSGNAAATGGIQSYSGPNAPKPGLNPDGLPW